MEKDYGEKMDIEYAKAMEDEPDKDKEMRHVFLASNTVPAIVTFYGKSGARSYDGMLNPQTGEFVFRDLAGAWSRVWATPINNLYIVLGTKRVIGEVFIKEQH